MHYGHGSVRYRIDKYRRKSTTSLWSTLNIRGLALLFTYGLVLVPRSRVEIYSASPHHKRQVEARSTCYIYDVSNFLRQR